MKKIIFSIFLSVFLFSCSSDEATNSPTGLQKIDHKEFTLSLPEKWKVIDDFSKLPVPRAGDISFIANAGEVKYGFTNNIIIVSQDLSKPVTSNDYSLLNNVWGSKDYFNYTKLSSQKITFSDKDTTTAYVFEAKYNVDTPVLKYIQFGKVCHQKKAYLITLAVSQDTKDVEPYIEFAKTFACK